MNFDKVLVEYRSISSRCVAKITEEIQLYLGAVFRKNHRFKDQLLRKENL